MPSDNPQKQFIEPLPTPREFERLPKDDIDEEALYDINQAVKQADAERRTKRAYANVGYAHMKKR